MYIEPTVTFDSYNVGGDKITPGHTEAWTMTCETPDGKVLESRDVTVLRGQQVTEDFACGASAPAPTAPSSGAVLGTRTGAGHLVISKRTVRLTKRGVARIRVLCVGGPCSGVLSLRTAKRYAVASRKGRFVALGRKAFALKPGQRAVLRVRVPAKARRLVARHRKVRALARAGIARQRLMLLRAR